jgi:four helix bundle protein
MHWKDLEVWKQAHSLVLVAYKLSNSFPDCERYRLTSQLCWAAVSVPANIVEGNARGSTKEYIGIHSIPHHGKGKPGGDTILHLAG